MYQNCKFHISHYSEYVFSYSLSIYFTLIIMMLLSYTIVIIMGLLIHVCKYAPFWQEFSVKSLILRWPLRPVGLLVYIFIDNLAHFDRSIKMLINLNRASIRGLSQNSVDWVYNFWSVQCILITFLHSVNCIIFYHNPKFQVCIMLAFWKKIIIFKIKIWTAEHHLTSKCVTLI